MAAKILKSFQYEDLIIFEDFGFAKYVWSLKHFPVEFCGILSVWWLQFCYIELLLLLAEIFMVAQILIMDKIWDGTVFGIIFDFLLYI